MSIIRVLLIEDDEDDYILTRDLLNEIGYSHYELEWVSDFDAGLELMHAGAHDLYLLDYRMGAHNGLEFLRAARSNGCTLPIIMLTGQGDRSVDLEAMKAGASDYLVKGQINATMFERSIRYAITQHQIEKQTLQLIREQEARALAEESNRFKDEFLAIVSHELRNPVNTMLGWVNLLKKLKQDPALIDQALGAIERSAEIQSKLIEDLLDVTRIANGTLRLEIKPLILGDVINSALGIVKLDMTAKDIDLEVDIDPAPFEMRGDPDRLRQVVCNLLSNAIKFTPRKGTIKVCLVKNANGATVTVSDSGHGIAPDFLPFVFERYRQADGADKQRHGGLGLGLSIVQKIVDMHSGTVHAHSDGTGRGATFTISFPANSLDESLNSQ